LTDGAGRDVVVVLLDSLVALGGAETLAVDHVVGLDPERYARVLCLTRDQDPIRHDPAQAAVFDRLDDAGVEVLELRRKHRFSPRPWVRLASFLRRRRALVVHGHKFGSNAWGVLCGRLAGTPVVVSHEHMWSYVDSSAVRRFADRRWVAPGSDALIAVSEEGRRQMIEIEHVDPADVVYVPNGVPDAPPGDSVRARARLQLGEDDFVLGTVALLRPEKQLELLVEAAALLRPSHPHLRVVIVGEGPERARLEAMIASRGLDETVTITGYRDDVQELLPAFDAAVCCSRFEGGPLSVMEYMEARLPVVATAVGGLPEMLEDGECGILVEPGDAAGIAEAVARLAADPDLRASLGARAFRRKRGTYSLEAWVRRIERLYDEILASKQLRAR